MGETRPLNPPLDLGALGGSSRSSSRIPGAKVLAKLLIAPESACCCHHRPRPASLASPSPHAKSPEADPRMRQERPGEWGFSNSVPIVGWRDD
jgi:hypothetical protein